MRLLDAERFTVVQVRDDAVPEYAILSHTWGDEEVSFQDVQLLDQSLMGRIVSGTSSVNRIKAKSGYSKIKRSAQLATEMGYEYIWIDTCCIDKTSSAELSEAINSMYRWYEQAAICVAYLSDVPKAERQETIYLGEDSAFNQSRWFTRGWTLQELIAPKDVLFYASDWTFIGSKLRDNILCESLQRITGIPAPVLSGKSAPSDRSVANRMEWAADRHTTRVEDIAYCLMGLFGVNMPLLYGEGKRAFIRLQEEILKETDDQSLFIWRMREQEVQADSDSQLCGLLADSPHRFSFSNQLLIRPLPPLETRESIPWSTTNMGLRVTLYLRPENPKLDEYLAILECSVWTIEEGQEGQDVCLAIVLKRLWGDQYARVRAYRMLTTKPPVDEHRVEDEGYKTIYVKQAPSYPPVEIAVARPRQKQYTNSDQAYQIFQVYPPERYDSITSSIHSLNIKKEGIVAIIRFVSSYNHHSTVDVEVSLIRTGGQWKPNFQQHAYGGESLENVFNHLLKHGSAANGLHSRAVPCNINLTHSDRRGRRYIELEVTGTAELAPEERHWGSNPPSPNSFETTLVAPIRAAAPIRILSELEVLIKSCTTVEEFRDIIFPSSEKRTDLVRVKSSNPSTMTQSFQTHLHSLRIRDDKPYTRLIEACISGDATSVSQTLWDEDDLIRARAVECQTEEFDDFRPLHWAASLGYTEMAQILVTMGAELDAVTRSGMTLSHLAALFGHSDLFDPLLFKYGRSVLEITEPISLGWDSPTPPGARVNKRTGETIVHMMAAYSPYLFESRRFRDLLQRSDVYIPLNPHNHGYETPLHRAAAMGNFEAASYLIENATDSVYSTDKYERSTLFHAACGGNPAIIKLMVAKGALIDLPDMHGRSPLHAAVLCNNQDAVSALVELGANTNQPTGPMGLTPAHIAALHGYEVCLKTLGSVSPDVNRPADLARGTTGDVYFEPLHLAAANGHIGCVQYMCKWGVDEKRRASHYLLLKRVEESSEGSETPSRLEVQVVNCGDLTPMEMADAQGHTEVSLELELWKHESVRSFEDIKRRRSRRDANRRS
ncbi:ankyrin repeat-containing domain protein [Podospora didyma]|uniref:Ankyrin repeat-containing domain protein n=1 Tax=Podospora didyma TaxID=330526 RepID=A0AAE0K1U5_9PEZI|nr:ankyrin repeat-containing domain protein [Podospora didyma]